ncbi:hypothetical protein HK102_011147 [Quaeritorhiza haematococci]|nr:hypothetical protein HK102_011147 [Quaeritorhiza haematococci]
MTIELSLDWEKGGTALMSTVEYRHLIGSQALVELWNKENSYYPSDVRVELNYGGHYNELTEARSETYRLLNEGVSILIGDLTSDKSINEQDVVKSQGVLQCSYSSNSPLLSDKTRYPTFIRTVPGLQTLGTAMADVLAYHKLTKVAVLSESNSYCDDWKSKVDALRASNATVMYHCGAFSFLSIMNELYNTDANYSYLLPYVRGTMMANYYMPDDGNNAYSQLLYRAYANMDPSKSFPLPYGNAPRNLSLTFSQDLSPASCLAFLIPTLSELVRNGKTSWTKIANRQLLTDVPLSDFVAAANGLKISGSANVSFEFDQNADLMMPVAIHNS